MTKVVYYAVKFDKIFVHKFLHHPLQGNGGAYLLDPNQFRFKVDQYTQNCDIVQASMKRHIKRYFKDGLNIDTNYENHISRRTDIKGSITEVELVMNNHKGLKNISSYASKLYFQFENS